MSLYSHGSDLRHASTGLPFWRGDTRIDEPAERCGKAWGVGCLTPEPALLGGGRSSLCGVGCWIFCGAGCCTRVDGGCLDGPAVVVSDAARAVRKASSAPKSSSMPVVSRRGLHTLEGRPLVSRAGACVCVCWKLQGVGCEVGMSGIRACLRVALYALSSLGKQLSTV